MIVMIRPISAMLTGNPEAGTASNSQKGTTTQGCLATNLGGSGAETQVVFGAEAPKALAYAQDTRLSMPGQRTGWVHRAQERDGADVSSVPRRINVSHYAFPDEELTLVETELPNLFKVEGDTENKYGLFGTCCLCALPDRLIELGETEMGEFVCMDCFQTLAGSFSEKRRQRTQERLAKLYAEIQYRLDNPLSVTRAVRAEVMERDAYRCRYCGGFTGGLSIDHVTPQSQGGSHKSDNLVVACMPCNLRKGARTPNEAGMPLLPLDGQA